MTLGPTSRSQEAAPPADLVQFLTFVLAHELYAMDIRTVREIIQPVPLTPVPLMPAFVRGVINLRGAVVPVIDLQARLGKPPAVASRKTCIVIFEAPLAGERQALGLLVDAVNEVLDLPARDIEPAPAFGNPIEREFIQGMGRVDGGFIILLEPARALDIEQMASLAPGMPALAG